MSIWNDLFGSKKVTQDTIVDNTENSSYHSRGRHWSPVVQEFFDGEKTHGELGLIVDSKPNFRHLRLRAYEYELKTDLVKIITGKFFERVVGTGLKLQSEPSKVVLEMEGIKNIDIPNFRKQVEARFEVYSESKMSDYKRMDNLHVLAAEAYKSAFIGGDCLCILRVEKGNVNLEVIDGEHVESPILDDKLMKAADKRGNEVRHGVEINKRGEHIAYFVKTVDKDNVLGKYNRIKAKGTRSGKFMAWLIYGTKHRLDHVRGIPVITHILGKTQKLDRYTEAIVGSAEERAKMVLSVVHDKDSAGENPFLDKVKVARGLGHNAALETAGYDNGERVANQIAGTTGKQIFNMPIGSSLQALDSKSESDYGGFSKAVFQFFCASVNIPPELALQVYEQNYSSSRAAINDWDFIAKNGRKRFSDKFYKNFYNIWLEVEIFKNNINAPGFVKAIQEGDFMVVESYSKCRYTGSNMPHIDPLKEVKAVSKMLDEKLISREQATEMLGLGDWEKNIEKNKKEEDLLPEPVETENNIESNEPDN